MKNYPTIEDAIGKTPLVALQRIGAADNQRRGNVVLGKLEGNNPAGSVKDRPALSMIQRAEERGEIRPGDTLIEATSGNTGIALAMAAAIKGYRMVLIMPEDLSIERAQTMKAFGAELMLTPKSGGMEYARDLAENMQREGKGRVLDQFANADNPRIHYETTGPEIWEHTGGQGHPLCERHGHHGHHHGVSRFLKEKNPAVQIIGAQPHRRLAHPGHPQVAAGVPAQDLRPAHGGRPGLREPGRCRRNVPPPGARRRHFCRHLGRGRLLGGPADCQRERKRHHRFHRV
jgi:cysteine synthase B